MRARWSGVWEITGIDRQSAPLRSAKIAGKNLAMIVANNVANTQIGFNSDANATTIFWSGGELNIPIMSKRALSERLIAVIADRIEATS